MKLPSSRHNKNRSNALNFIDCVDKADKWREDKVFCLIPILQVGNWGRERLKSDSLNSTWEKPQITNSRYSRSSASPAPNPLLYPNPPPSGFHRWFLSAPRLSCYCRAGLLISFFLYKSFYIYISLTIYCAWCHTLDQSVPSFKGKRLNFRRVELTLLLPLPNTWSSHRKDSDGSEKGRDDLC